jgi:hypothetical protein
VLQNCSGNGYTLLLAAAQLYAAFAYNTIQPVR